MKPAIKPVEAGFNTVLQRQDLITPILPLIKSGAMYLTDDGTVKPTVRGIQPETPWVHVRTDPEKDCGMWHGIMFDHYKILPSPCFECWKVVVAPRTLRELFALLDIQENHWDKPCKCGIEVREHTPRLYGGYFYSRSLDEGQDTWWKVRKLVADRISSSIDVVLKRACTEFEMHFGPSNQWQLKPNQLNYEEAIYNLFGGRSDVPGMQPETAKMRVYRAWIQWAYKHGDETYLEYNGGVPLYPQTVKYHDVDLSTLETKTMEMVRPCAVQE